MENPSNQPFDLVELSDRCLGDPDFISEMLNLFRNQTPPTLVRLQQAVTSGDVGQASSAAHRLKGSAGNIAAKQLLAALVGLEQLLRTNRLLEAQQQLEVVVSLFNAAIAGVPDALLQVGRQRDAA